MGKYSARGGVFVCKQCPPVIPVRQRTPNNLLPCHLLRTFVSLGGDCDTLTCIAGSIAEGFYGVPEELKQQCREHLPEDLRKVLRRLEEALHL